MDLQKYFYPDYEFYLDKVRYNRKPVSDSSYELRCLDNISVSKTENGVSLIVSRSLVFEPDEVFDLFVSFGADLRFREETMHEIDWNEVDLTVEFKENGSFVISNLSSRISALIANITSSFGQSPIVLPPAYITGKH